MADCLTASNTRRRIFWTTQPDVCGEEPDCPNEYGFASSYCGMPGLQYVTPTECQTTCCDYDPTLDPNCAAYQESLRPKPARTFANNDWARSLLLNILNTVARQPATYCGDKPGTQGGHWSESYIEGPTGGLNGVYIGTQLLNGLPTFKAYRDAVQLVNAIVTKDAYKLVKYGVASSIDVQTAYIGKGRISVAITIFGPRNVPTGRVNLVGATVKNQWVWGYDGEPINSAPSY